MNAQDRLVEIIKSGAKFDRGVYRDIEGKTTLTYYEVNDDTMLEIAQAILKEFIPIEGDLIKLFKTWTKKQGYIHLSELPKEKPLIKIVDATKKTL